MKSFIEWLEAKIDLPVVQDDNRELIFGAYGAMKQMPGIGPRIAEFGGSSSKKQKLGGQEYQIDQDTNPYLLIVWDNNNKLISRGSNNCAVCKNYDIKKRTCSWPTSRPITQSFIRQHDIGGCVGLDFLPAFGSGHEQNKKYEDMQYELAKGYIFRYAHGKIDTDAAGQFKPIAGPFTIDQKEEDYEALSPWEKQEKEKGYS